MAIPSRQIGWSTKANLLWQISKQLEQLIKVSAPNKIRDLIALFKLRVGFNDGTFEAEACLDATLTNLDNIDLLDKASLIITPNAYNPGVLYDVVPNNNLGDMNVVRATTATRVNELGLIEEVGLNVPRLDYTNGSCPSLLVEPQRTNLLTYSNDFSNAAWIMFAGPPVTPNSIISPDGLTNGTTLNSAGGANDFLYQVITTTIGVAYTNSFYIKNLNATQSQYLDVNGSGVLINWSGSTLTSIIGIGSSFVSVNNGWYRVFTTVTATNTFYVYRIYADVNNTSKSVYIYGAQLEQGSYLTSYIPTVASSATRNADVISKTGISSLIGQTEGTVFLDFIPTANDGSDLFSLNLSVDNSVSIGKDGANIKATIFNSGTSFNINGGSYIYGNRYKIALVYKNNNSKVFVNGILKNTNTSNLVFNGVLNNLYNYGTNYYEGNSAFLENSVQLYKTALTDTECIALTTL